MCAAEFSVELKKKTECKGLTEKVVCRKLHLSIHYCFEGNSWRVRSADSFARCFQLDVFSLHLSEIAETQISHGAMSVIDAMLNVLKVLAEAAAVVCLHIFACSCSTNVVYITVVVARRTTATNILLFPYMFWHISISNLLWELVQNFKAGRYLLLEFAFLFCLLLRDTAWVELVYLNGGCATVRY